MKHKFLMEEPTNRGFRTARSRLMTPRPSLRIHEIQTMWTPSRASTYPTHFPVTQTPVPGNGHIERAFGTPDDCGRHLHFILKNDFRQ